MRFSGVANQIIHLLRCCIVVFGTAGKPDAMPEAVHSLVAMHAILVVPVEPVFTALCWMSLKTAKMGTLPLEQLRIQCAFTI